MSRNYKFHNPEQFKKSAENSSNEMHYQFWRHDNKLVEFWSNKILRKKVKSTDLGFREL